MITIMEMMAAQRSPSSLGALQQQLEAKERRGGSSAPSLETALLCSEGTKGAPQQASLDPGCRSWETSKMSLRKVLGSGKTFII